MTRSSNSWRSRYRRRLRRRRSRGKSVVGSLLLEVIAIILLMIVTTSQHGRESSPKPALPADLTAPRTTEFGSMIAGFLSDQWDRNQLNYKN